MDKPGDIKIERLIGEIDYRLRDDVRFKNSKIAKEALEAVKWWALDEADAWHVDFDSGDDK